MAVVTDGLRAYEDAITKEFFTLKAPRTEHIRIPNIRDRSNNNMVDNESRFWLATQITEKREIVDASTGLDNYSGECFK